MQIIPPLPALAGLTLVLASTAGAQTQAELIRSELQLDTYQLATIDVPAELDGQFSLRVPMGGHTMEIWGTQQSQRAQDFQVLVDDGSGNLVQHVAPEVATYRGFVTGVADSFVTSSIQNGMFFGQVHLMPGLSYGIHALHDIDPSAPINQYVIYDEADVLWEAEWKCGLDELAPTAQTAVPFVPQTAQLGTGLRLVEIAFDTDYEFYQDNGSSVNAAVLDIENIFNGVTGIYENDLNITFEVTTIVVRSSSSDPYSGTSAGNVLDQFRATWSGMSYIRRDVAHIMSGRTIQGGTLGVAWLGSVCDSANGFQYGFSWSTFTSNQTNRRALTAHEIGHNHSADHCDGASGGCRIMCSGLGGCGSPTFFAPVSVAVINNFNMPCAPNLAVPRSVPWSDGFFASTVNVNNWISNQGATSSTGASNEPSASRSLNLDAVGSGANQDNWIRSNRFLMNGLSNVTLSYWTEARGVESGEELVVEYLNSFDFWVEVNRVTSNGTTQNNFDFHSHVLPAQAYHDGFRLQFRVEVDSSGDDWYIDDIALTTGPTCTPATTYCVTAANSAGPGAIINSSGTGFISNNDLTLAVSGAIANQFGLFFFGASQIQAPFGDGFRCVGAGGVGTWRFPVLNLSFFGDAAQVVDQNSLPFGSTISAGETWNFQFWYRDPGGPGGTGFNLSNGLSVPFCP